MYVRAAKVRDLISTSRRPEGSFRSALRSRAHSILRFVFQILLISIDLNNTAAVRLLASALVDVLHLGDLGSRVLALVGLGALLALQQGLQGERGKKGCVR